MSVKVPTITTSKSGPVAFLLKKRFSTRWLTRPLLEGFRLPKFPVSSFPLVARLRISTWVTLLILTFYLLFCAYVVSIWAAPEALGTGTIRLGPDSTTYYALGESIQNSTNKLPLLALGSNLIGPIAVVVLLGNPFLVAMFNATLLLAALYVASTIRRVSFAVFTMLILLDAETLSAVTTVNKEIFALFSAVLLAKYLDAIKRSWLVLLLACISAVMARWEHLAVILLFLAFQRSATFKQRPKTALLLVISGMSIAWPFILRSVDTAGFDYYTEGAKTMAVLNAIQGHFGYFLVVIPKVVMNLVGAGSSPAFWLSVWPTMDHSDIQNAFLIRLHELMTTCIIGIALLSKKISLKSPLIFFCALYLAVTCANLFIQSRYDYPVYVLLCLTVASGWVEGHTEMSEQDVEDGTPKNISPSSNSRLRSLEL